VRALDYLPPLDVTFGDFLRAVITADFEQRPDDELGVRDALMQAFRLRGIVPEGALFFSETAIAWPRAQRLGLPPVEGLDFGDPNGLTREEQETDKKVLTAYFNDPDHKARMGFEAAIEVDVVSFHPVFRLNADGSLRTDLVVEAVQECQVGCAEGAPSFGTFPMRGGATVFISKPSLDERKRSPGAAVRYVIAKHLGGGEGTRRQGRQRSYYSSLGLFEGDDPARFQVDFALVHGGL
jgi:hypothetical protein